MPESHRKQGDNIDQLIKTVRKELQGPVNRTIDHLLHPHFHKYPFLILVDGLLHGLNEADPVQSIQKFLRYNAPKLIQEIERAQRNPRRC
ncbi:MAG: hypothetical protein OEY22_02265 [Candidatus Bathyarchaeota archaeon]|nr:hypothetical protein [Candidatus Bathyarchaeota archaeon]